MHSRWRDKIVCMVGLGYIGLPTAAVLASRGIRVLGVDTNPQIVESVNASCVRIVEPDLDMLVHASVAQGKLSASGVPAPADVFVIAVPTPFDACHEADLSYIEAAAHSVAPVLCPGNLVILESTSPIGATEQMSAWLAQLRPDLSFPQTVGEVSDIRIAHCPERVLPGRILRELVDNDRVIGGMTPKCARLAASLYATFVHGECVETTVRTAEMCKLAENAFRDVNIAFANELSMICDKLNIDVWELIKLANRHPRVDILRPGCGVGGHCIAVDPWFIIKKSPEHATLMRAAREVNDTKPGWIIDKVEGAVDSLMQQGMMEEDIRIACLGLAFKADVDDLRESPALAITAALARRYPGQVQAVEPNIENLPQTLVDLGVMASELESACRECLVIVLLVEHAEFKKHQFTPANNQRLIDSIGIWKAQQ